MKHFTPVHVRLVQSALFHERAQKQGELVDVYAQELKKLYRRAYPKMSHDRGEEGRAVLALGVLKTRNEMVNGNGTECKTERNEKRN